MGVVGLVRGCLESVRVGEIRKDYKDEHRLFFLQNFGQKLCPNCENFVNFWSILG